MAFRVGRTAAVAGAVALLMTLIVIAAIFAMASA